MADLTFLIRLSGVQQHLLDPDVVKAHAAWLGALDAAGRLLIAGPTEDGAAVVVIRAQSRAEAQKISESDPFAQVGAYAEREVLRFSQAHAGNDYLLRLEQGRIPSPRGQAG